MVSSLINDDMNCSDFSLTVLTEYNLSNHKKRWFKALGKNSLVQHFVWLCFISKSAMSSVKDMFRSVVLTLRQLFNVVLPSTLLLLSKSKVFDKVIQSSDL